MKFSAREDVEIPIDQVFAAITDFETHERSAMRRGVQVERNGDVAHPGPGLTWGAKAKFRGRVRDVAICLQDFRAPEVVGYLIEGAGLEGKFVVELVALSKQRTRLGVALDLKPKTITGRLQAQSLRMIKPTLNRRFKLRVADYARQLSQDVEA